MSKTLKCAALLLSLGASKAVLAQRGLQQFEFNRPAEDLAKALRNIADQTGTDLIAPTDLLAGKLSPPMRGRYSVDEAISALLQNSGLHAEHHGTAILIRRGEAKSSDAPHVAKEADSIFVTGSRIRGAPTASPVIRLSEEMIRERGQGTLAEAVRTIPQNFGGGQNPGVGNNVPAAKGVNVGSSTSVNLRGLGSDATLTLVNGHRISYSASRQAIDISTVPLFAVERMEIVPDGASALYGSDAVAGVVNVILKRDFSGIMTGARWGASTEGGDAEQRYDVTAGTRWPSGGFVASYEYGRTTPIIGRDRSYTKSSAPALTLYPFLRNHSLAVSGHQKFGPDISFEVDAFFNDRLSKSSYALNSNGDIAQSGASFRYDERAIAVAPTLRWRPSGDWTLFLTGSYGRDHARYDVKSYFAGQVFDFPGNCYCNHAVALELGGEGALFALPAGPVRIAVGTGYRRNKLVRFNGVGSTANISKGQNSFYGYGEVNVPLISPDQQMAGINRLSLSAAGRYERYPGIGDVLTPKVAAIYAPSSDLDLKASWGKSFRAPTLYQQYQAVNLVLATPALFGGAGFSSGSTALYWEGGNPDLKPERANSLSATFDLHPDVLKGTRLQLSYFRTKYRDRVVTPIPFPTSALADPIYADRAIFNPSSALLASVVASASSFGNATATHYDPASVAVLIDNRSTNAGYQIIRGADLLFSYQHALPRTAGDLRVAINATYLESRQQLDAAQPELPLAGIIFNPPHWSGRADVGWTRGQLTVNAGLNYRGGVEDRRSNSAVHVRGMTTFDLTTLLKSAIVSGPAKGLEASLTVQNVFNVKPARIAIGLPSDAPYDSTNYSPVGRFVAVSVIKQW